MVIILKKSETNPGFGKKPIMRTINELLKYGVVNLDKPSGPTSHQVVEFVEEILNVKKAGHSGTLDPKVTGVLPIMLGRGTKVIQAVLKASKKYVCLAHFHKKITKRQVKLAVKQFTGEITQLPPKKSNVKRVKRKRNVYSIDILEIKGNDVLMIVECEAGTYIRKLIHDMGEFLGIGANMQELRRVKAGPFTEEMNLVTLQDLSDAMHYYKKNGNEKYLRFCVLPVEVAVSHLKKIWICDSAVKSLCQGAQLNLPGISKIDEGIEKGEFIAIMSLKGELVALADALMSSNEMKKKKKGRATKTRRVIMERGVYF